jgi:hypothetical protein
VKLLGRAGAAASVATLLAVVGLAYARQRQVYLERQAALQQSISAAQEQRRRLEAVASKLVEFQSKVRQLEADLQRLNELLPPAFLEQGAEDELRSVARASGLKIGNVRISQRYLPSLSQSGGTRYGETTFSLDVEGPRAAAERFARLVTRTDEEENKKAREAELEAFSRGRAPKRTGVVRLYCVDEIFLPGPRGKVRVRAFSYPEPWPAPPRAKPGPIQDPFPAVLFSLEPERQRLDVAGRRLLELSAIGEKVEEFQAKERVMQEKLDLVNRLRSSPIATVESVLRAERVSVTDIALVDLVSRGQAPRAAVRARSYGVDLELSAADRLSDGIVRSVTPDRLILEATLSMGDQPTQKRLLLLTPRVQLPAIAPARDTTWIEGPLLPDGTPDYGAWLNRKYGAGVTRDNNAAPRLESALASLVEASYTFWDGIPAEQWTRKVQVRPWSESECPQCARRLSLNEKPLAAVTQATRLPRYFTAGPAGKRIANDWTFPRLLPFRVGANALAGRGMLRLGRGDVSGAIEDALTTQRLALLVSQGPTLIERLIAIAIRGIGVAILPRAATTSKDSAQVRRLLQELQGLPQMPHVETSIDEVERVFSLDIFLNVRELTSDGRTGAVLDLLEPAGERGTQFSTAPPPEAYLLPAASVDWAEGLRLVNRRFDFDMSWLAARSREERTRVRAAAEAEQKAHKAEVAATLASLRKAVRSEVTRAADVAAAAEKLGSTDQGRRQLAGLWSSEKTSSLARSSVAGNEAEAQFRMAVLAVALAAHKLEHGGYPGSLAELGPGLGDPAVRGYVLRYHVGSKAYALTAAAEEPGETANRGFCVDSSGAMRFTTNGSAPKPVADGTCDAAAALLR